MRVILNKGTELKPLTDVIPGSKWGKGERMSKSDIPGPFAPFVTGQTSFHMSIRSSSDINLLYLAFIQDVPFETGCHFLKLTKGFVFFPSS